ncbi:LacI family transcriptional regulator [Microlunatus elymi]|uniref:LacI family transcriptional regulator n=1 Tax=Microlunatus elymi TaxID=2596828 RepID=A0A516Q0X6_9ACTN|nr:LacI family DNA-binding transcriptional regulator [Microlunatus elymi]QDP97080.1 LacI family transcriptional regulator [Microlunatus elymi]
MITRKPRLEDVAQRAGVSMKTVSNVINGYPHISAKTLDRVQTAIDALGYRPNLSARNLARGRAGMYALIVPQLDRPYFAALARHVIDAAHEVGAVVLIEQTGGDLEAERRVISGEFSRRVDGMIFSPMTIGAEEIANRSDATPLVLPGEHVDQAGAPHLGIDNQAAARLATRHLIDLGRTRLGMIGVGRPRQSNPRYRGFRQALTDVGPRAEPRWLRTARGVSGADGEAAMTKIISDGNPLPDGIFCATDWLALGAIRALLQNGIRVPEDVAVIGFDDIPYGAVSTPSLSTIATNRGQIAQQAIRLLKAPGTEVDHDLATIDFRLVIRESTAG